MVNDSVPSSPKKKKKSKNKTLHATSEPVVEKEPAESPNNVSISDAETQDGEEHESSHDNDDANNDDNNIDNDAPPNDDNEPEKEVEV